ncbi:aromatic ring-hydroxylating dioxygenase subunit alpha [Sphingomonas baiyangensis]|uniref:Aromatic ring-hydroxylating dioxygenase subunit alpha n=1 Tax=Sphingomonas baiyangensis TaxID=2572576 RepID=A0A4U1L1F0_9SPHN|nr:aromatic ring-hydroxylating dioxygenase subunit alpha [Sphingomonas baiyangensis]TKD50661.1 aromatic ring-hydroxylating dioxygenase subunit alpha [Sphingomonas baiyangensis]
MHYVRNAWYVAGWEQDLPAATPTPISILDELIVIWRTADGTVTALEDRCVHRLAPLSLGRCEGDRLRCMYHGLLFDAEGQVVEIPGQDLIPRDARVRRYPVIVRHSWLWVWMGDPALADADLVPPAVGFDNPRYILGRGQLDYAAEARLINDNLLDFSHLSYVHTASFGASETWARSRPKISTLERGVRIERWIENEQGMHSPEPNDRWSTYDFLLPGVLLMTGGNYPVGTAARLGHAPPDLEDALSGVTFTSQAVTPTRPGQARYFFSWGPRTDMGDAALAEKLMGIAAKAFAEDKAIIEAQQRVIDRTPDPRIMPTTADKAVTLFSRLVDRLVRAESSPALPARQRAAH